MKTKPTSAVANRYKITQINNPLYMSVVTMTEALCMRQAVTNVLGCCSDDLKEVDLIGFGVHAVVTKGGKELFVELVK